MNQELATAPVKNPSELGRGPHQLIEEQSERTPHATALICGPEQISYSELSARSHRLAHFLREQGVGPETLVGAYLDRSVDSVVSLLAILKSGGTYLPLDPRFPKDRLAFVLADSEVSVVLTHSRNQGSLPESSARVIPLDGEDVAFAGAPLTDTDFRNNPEHLAYLIYTSGSTGKPKGVMIPRLALTNFLLAMAKTPGMTRSDRHLAVTTTSFDISLLELLLPLACGAQIIIASAEQASDPSELRRLLEEHAVTVMQATPATWRLLIESGWEGKRDLRVFCGGEALARDLAAKLLPRCRELWNLYGPTETTIWSSTERVVSADCISLGSPIANTQFYVFDETCQPVPHGTSGELWIGGAGVARGYLRRPELTAKKFFVHPTAGANTRLYRTGDKVRYRRDGTLEFLGRLDQQVKLNGFRIELGEIECAMRKIEGIDQVVVVLREDRPGNKRLVAYYTSRTDLNSSFLIQSIKTTLPEYMVPAVFVRMEKLPLSPNGKVDRKALPPCERTRPFLAQDFVAPRSVIEKNLASLWCDLLQWEEVGIDDSFFDLGGNSLAAVRMTDQYHTRFGGEIPLAKVFQYRTIAKLARFLERGETKSDLFGINSGARHLGDLRDRTGAARDSIAIVGMVGRFPGAANLDQLWRNLCSSVESISFFRPEELGPGIPANLRNHPDYIRARGLIEGADLFDASFFGISPVEARVMDPQQRVFLELAQQALENAGYDPERYKGRIGVFSGMGDNLYYTTNLLVHPDLLAMAGELAVEYGNQKDYIALRTAYLLDLRGPAVSLNTACSTTLLTVDQAYRSLLDYECDIALAGGVDVGVPQKKGFLYQEGGLFTKDGHCRPFDADASGTMFCDGAGVVVLQRLSDALNDGNMIYAVIVGTGKNNNGARPVSFLAPSAEGQAEAIALAQSNANVPVETIRYIEAHGTGTPVGDPIEFEALRTVFENKTDKKQFCYIGSIKGNIGHSTNAAGIAGLIKAALVLHHQEIPPTLHFRKANPKINFPDSPFIMSDKLIPFPRGKEVRRTAVSSFGFGGTNVHAILEEAPERPQGARPSRPLQLLPISARSLSALDAYSLALAQYLESSTPESLPDAAYTFQTGRRQFGYRRFVVAGDSREAAKLLLQSNPLRCSSRLCQRRNPGVVFLFGGQGNQYENMGLNLYRDEPVFRAIVDHCCECLKPHLGSDLRELLYRQNGGGKTAEISLQDTFLTQPAIFVIEYALARFWESLGVEPAMMVGHSIGEFVAATLANVWKLEEALAVVALRGRLMQNLPRGSMMAVNSSADAIAQVLPSTLQIACNNAPALCVVSGPDPDVSDFQKQLEGQNIVCRYLHSSHAFHSAMIDPIVEPLRDAIAGIQLRPPTRPFISTVTGSLITAKETTDPGYWARHSRATVEFSKAIRYLKDEGYDLFLECGPRATMCSLARQHFSRDRSCTAIPTLADTHENNSEWATLLFALGSLWQSGVGIDWDAFYANEDRRRIPLPTYPFERRRFWVDPAPSGPIPPELVTDTAAFATHPAVDASPAPQGREPDASVKSLISRRDRIASRLIELLVPLCGHEGSEISRTATFIEQGFDSLSLTQVVFAVQKEFSVKVSISQLIREWPNLELLTAHIEATSSADNFAEATTSGTTEFEPGGTPVAADVPTRLIRLEAVVAEQARTIASLVHILEKSRPSQATVPTADQARSCRIVEVESTISQQAMFASSFLSTHLRASYNESITLRLTGTVSIEKMTQALNRLIDRHDALRASFDQTGSVMKINHARSIAMPIIDLSLIGDPVLQEEQLRRLIAHETASPFRLPEGPLFRCQMVLLAQDRAAVLLTSHHIVCDAWSLDVLIHDLCAFYSEEISGKPVSLSQPASYADYVRRVSDREHSEEFKEAARYWHLRFKGGLPVLVLPTDRPRETRRDFQSRRIDYQVPTNLSQDLRALGRQSNCTFFAVFASSLAIALARISRQRRFVIALPSAEQLVIGEPGLVGDCVNLLPLAVELREGETATGFLGRVQKELLVTQEHAAFTVVSLLGNLRPARLASRMSAIPAGLTTVKRFKPAELPQSGFKVEYDVNPKSYESFELYLNAVESEQNFEIRCNYDVTLFDEGTIREWLRILASIFQDITEDPLVDVLDLARLKDVDPSSATEIVYSCKPQIESRLVN